MTREELVQKHDFIEWFNLKSGKQHSAQAVIKHVLDIQESQFNNLLCRYLADHPVVPQQPQQIVINNTQTQVQKCQDKSSNFLGWLILCLIFPPIIPFVCLYAVLKIFMQESTAKNATLCVAIGCVAVYLLGAIMVCFFG